MRHVVLFFSILVVFVLSSSASPAENGGRGRGNQSAGAADKDRGKAAKETAAAQQQGEEQAAAAKEKAQKQKEAPEEKAKQAKEDTAEAAPQTVKAARVKPSTDQAAAAAKTKGAGKAQKGEALANQLVQESEKHQRRQERLQEMLRVAEGKGDEKIIQRIRALMEKENNRYEKKQAKMLQRQSKDASGEAGE